MKSVSLLIIIVWLAEADDFYYRRILACVEDKGQKCTTWAEITRLSYYINVGGWCFSEDIHVLTIHGERPMKAIQVGD